MVFRSFRRAAAAARGPRFCPTGSRIRAAGRHVATANWPTHSCRSPDGSSHFFSADGDPARWPHWSRSSAFGLRRCGCRPDCTRYRRRCWLWRRDSRKAERVIRDHNYPVSADHSRGDAYPGSTAAGKCQHCGGCATRAAGNGDDPGRSGNGVRIRDRRRRPHRHQQSRDQRGRQRDADSCCLFRWPPAERRERPIARIESGNLHHGRTSGLDA